MRLALLSHSVIRGDGQGRVNYELTRYLLAHGVEVHLIADEVAPELLTLGATWKPVQPRLRRINLFKTWTFRRTADRLLRRSADTFDGVIACGAVTSQPHTVNVAHFVHTAWRKSPFHTSRVRRGAYAWYHWVYSTVNAMWERQAFRQAAAVVAVSPRVRDELLEAGVPPAKSRVIPNGVDAAEFRPGEGDRAALGLPDGMKVALFVGDLRSPIKNLDGLLDALRSAPGVHLAVAGRVDRSPYPARVVDLELQDRVHFLGYREDLAAVMRAADFFVLPSHSDTFGLVLLEAMASGLPVVTTRAVGASVLVTPDCGVVIERSDDTEALASALRALGSDASARLEMARSARAVAERHGWDYMGEAYLRLFLGIATVTQSQKLLGQSQNG